MTVLSGPFEPQVEAVGSGWGKASRQPNDACGFKLLWAAALQLMEGATVVIARGLIVVSRCQKQLRADYVRAQPDCSLN